MPGEAAAEEHNGDIWSRPPTKPGANPAGKIQVFLLKNSIRCGDGAFFRNTSALQETLTNSGRGFAGNSGTQQPSGHHSLSEWILA